MSDLIFEEDTDFNFSEENEIYNSYDMDIMDQLLYMHYIENDCDRENCKRVFFSEEEWLTKWREYVESDKGIDRLWRLRVYIGDWDDVRGILKRLEFINKKEPELFHELFTGNFVSCLLFNLVFNGIEIKLNKRKITTLAKWIQKHKVQEFSQDDFWRVVQEYWQDMFHPFAKATIQYSQLWRACCQKPIYISMKKPIQKKVFDVFRKNEIENAKTYFVFSEYYDGWILDFCDRVNDNEKIKDNVLVELLLNLNNVELIYKFLKKNIITAKLAKDGLKKAVADGKSDLIPMLMLKMNGEWE